MTFIPVFIDKKESESRWDLLGSFIVIGLLAGTLISGLIFIFSDQLIDLQSPGLATEVKEYSSFLLQCFVIIIVITIINEIIAGIFYADGEFVIPMINKIISPVITISIIYFFGDDSNAFVIVMSTLVGAAVQLAILMVNFYRKGYRMKVRSPLMGIEVRTVLKLMIPLLIGSMFYKFLPVFDKFILSDLSLGSVSIINYSQKLFLAATQVLGAALSMQVFTHMSALNSEGKSEELKKVLNTIVRLILYITIPVTGICFLFGTDIIRIIYERGEFTASNTIDVANSFKIYVLAIPGVLLGTVISQGLYVMKDTWSPFYVGISEVLLYGVLSVLLIGTIGIIALPIAYVVYFYFSVVLLGIILSRKISFIKVADLIVVIAKFLVLIGIEMVIVYFIRQNYSFSIFWSVLMIGTTFAVYFIASYLLRLRESKFVFDKLAYESNKVFKAFQKKEP